MIAYVPFDTNLNLFKKNKNYSIFPSFLWYSLVSCLSLVSLIDHEANILHFSLAIMPPNFDFLSYFELIFYLFSEFEKTYFNDVLCDLCDPHVINCNHYQCTIPLHMCFSNLLLFFFKIIASLVVHLTDLNLKRHRTESRSWT